VGRPGEAGRGPSPSRPRPPSPSGRTTSS
jgi:hypothetical protein